MTQSPAPVDRKPRYFVPETPEARQLIEAWLSGLTTGDLAEIRRCRGPLDVAFAPAFHRLRHRIAAAGLRANPDALAAGLIVAFSLRRSGAESVAEAFGGRGGEDPPLSERRLQRLARCPADPGRVAEEFRRAATSVDGTVDRIALLALAYRWCIPALQESAKRRLLFDYYDAAQTD